MKKDNIILYICIIVFVVISIYLIFFYDNTKKYNNKIEAYNIVDGEYIFIMWMKKNTKHMKVTNQKD